VIDVTLLGEVDPGEVLYRRGAHPGDRILVTGPLGDAAAGLTILLGQAPADFTAGEYLITRHQLPAPRLAAGRAIARSRLATAMIDLSDGLASDLGHLAEESRVGAVILADQIPTSPPLEDLARIVNRPALDWALRGGEDYELLLTAPGPAVQALRSAVEGTGVDLFDIGEITADRGLWIVGANGHRAALGGVSWHHFGSAL
jgi:thiamine-monophosphate kinase